MMLFIVYVDYLAYSSDMKDSIVWFKNQITNNSKTKCVGDTNNFLALRWNEKMKFYGYITSQKH
eukprot:snap_masked-scaffold_4-processed-gene-5.31-mRNA-1 protein AED:1.00 eAED:1.00 QI:0/-1/0/0/-1/1/1/0/63